MNPFKDRGRRFLAGAIGALTLGVAGAAYATDEPFNITMTLYQAIVITETQALSFPNTTSGGAIAVTVAPADGTAAIFTATGEPSTGVTGSVVESSIVMQHSTWSVADVTKEITVDTFTTGGNLSGAGAGTFDGTGNITDMRIGGTANVQANDIAGAYSGSATFRLVY